MNPPARPETAPSRRKPSTYGNFRVSGLPFDGQFATEVGLPTVGLVYSAADPRRPEATVASLARGELRLQIAARSTGLVMAWVRRSVVDGRVGPDEACRSKWSCWTPR